MPLVSSGPLLKDVRIGGELPDERRQAALDAPLFPSYSGKPLTRTDANRQIRKWAASTGINGTPAKPDLTTHGLRLTFTTTLVERGRPEWAVARLCGDPPERSEHPMVGHYTGDNGEKELRELHLKHWPKIGLSRCV